MYISMYYYIFTCKIFFFSYVNEINMRYLLIEQAGQLYLVEICRLLYIWIFYTVHNHWLLAIASDCTSICVYLYCICIFIVQSKINLLTTETMTTVLTTPGKRPLWRDHCEAGMGVDGGSEGGSGGWGVGSQSRHHMVYVECHGLVLYYI